MKLHGRDGSIKISGTPLTAKTTWEISIEREFADVTVFSDDGKTSAGGLRAATGSFDGFYDAGSEAAVAAANSDVPVPIEVWASAGVMVASGMAFVNLAASAGVTDAVRCRGTIKGQGRWNWA